MVLELTDELLTYNPSDEQLVVDCISNLLLGYYESNHVLMASSLFCDYFKTLIKEDRAKRALQHLSNNNAYLPNVLWTMKVRLNPDKDVSKHEISLLFFCKTSSVQPSILLCENLNDATFYKNLCAHYYYQNAHVMDGYLGGGDTTYTLHKALKGRNRLALTILDSDSKYPGCDIGGTAKKVRKADRRPVSHVMHYIIKVHEIENLIPFPFIERASCKDGQLFLRQLKDHNVLGKYLGYYDVKKGIPTIDDVNTGFNKFAKDIYTDIYGSKNGTYEQYVSQCKIKDKKNFKNNIPPCGLFPKLRADMLDRFIDSKPIIYSYNDSIEPERKYIADLIYTVSCARDNNPIQ